MKPAAHSELVLVTIVKNLEAEKHEQAIVLRLSTHRNMLSPSPTPPDIIGTKKRCRDQRTNQDSFPGLRHSSQSVLYSTTA